MEKMKWIKKGISALLALNMVLSSVPLPVFAVTEDNLCEHHTAHTADCGYAEAVAGVACGHEHSEDCYAIVQCIHEHDESCGTDGVDCVHECTVDNGCITMDLDCHHTHGDCGYSEGTAEVPCGHQHDGSCGYVEAVAEVLCACTETDESGALIHAEDCGYVAPVEGVACGHTEHLDCGYAPATEGTPCTHTHAVKVDSADSCYKLLCSHKDGGHDDACGYVAAVEAHECHYECAECVAALTADETTEPSTEATEPSTEPAPVCNCGTDDPAIHATTCAVYVAPETAVCYCAEKCSDTNVWCDVCGFDYTQCGGTDAAAAYAEGAVASVTVGGTTTSYDTFDAAITAVQSCTADDEAVLTLLKEIPLGDTYQKIEGGVFTLDLNGKLLSNTDTYGWEALQVGGGAQLTIIDSGTGGTIQSATGAAVRISEGDLIVKSGTLTGRSGVSVTSDCSATINGGNIHGTEYGIYCSGTVRVYGGTVTSDKRTVYVNSGSVTINSGDFTGSHNAVYIGSNGSVTINGGSFTGGSSDFSGYGSVSMTGATFPGGITLSIITLNAALADGQAYWTGDTMLAPADGATEITDKGDITVKAACTHDSGSKSYTDNGDNHTYTYSCCNLTVTEAHTYTDGTCTGCGKVCPHTGGTATCTQKAVCTICGAEYGDLVAHSYGDWESNGDGTHSRTCTICSTATEKGNCSGGTATCTEQAKCEICGTSHGELIDHTFGTDGICTTCGTQAAAKIGDTYYTTLSAAAAEVTEGGTIEILTDVTIAEDENVTFAEGVTLKVAEGKTITCNGTVKIGEKDGIIFENKLYYYGGDITSTGLTMNTILVTNTYYKAGDGYVIRNDNSEAYTINLTMHNATINAEGYGLYVESSNCVNFNINYSGSNSITGSEGIDTVGYTKTMTLNGAAESTLNVTGTSGDGIFFYDDNDQNLTLNGGAVTAQGATWGVSVGGTLNITSGTTLNATGGVVGLFLPGTITGAGTVNALVLEGEEDNTKYAYSTMGDAVISTDTTAFVMEGVTTTFAVPAATSLTVKEGVTLDLSALAIDNIQFLGTITNNGTIKLPADFNLGNAPKSGTVVIGEDSYTWNGEKWICGETTHTGGTATCTTLAVCEICGTPYGELAKDNHTGTLGTYAPTEDGTQHTATWSCCSTTVTEDHTAEPSYTVNEKNSAQHNVYYSCCGATVTEAHTGEDDGDHTTAVTCTVCGGTITEATSHSYTNGFCTNTLSDGTVCDEYEPATDSDGDGYYEIGNAGQLYWFAEQVNGGKNTINAVLTKDIVVNEGTMDYYSTDARPWTPIGNSTTHYTGTFDGNGHTISGLYYNQSSSGTYLGLFGYVGSAGIVKQLGVISSYFGGSQYAGGVAGWNDGTVENCFATGEVVCSQYPGGIVGWNTGTVNSCFAYAEDVRGGTGIGFLVGYNKGTVMNSYCNGPTSEYVHTGPFGYQNGTVDAQSGKMTDAQFASGEVAYLLQGEQTEQIWGQTLGTENADALPILGGAKVYAGYDTCANDAAAAYANTALPAEKPHTYENGICEAVEGEIHYEPAKQNESGIYEIGNAGQLMWFAELVNGGEKTANAILIDNIDMDGIDWTPICSTGLYYNTTTYTDKGYEGTFDGGGYTISNLKITGTDGVKASYGLFGTLSGTVKNLGMSGMTFSYADTYDTNTTDARAGAIAGQMLDGSLISDCFVVDSSLTPNNYIVGGIAGCNYAGTIQDCYTKNVTISAHSRCGNLVSDTRGDISTTDRPGTVKNCYTDASRVVGTNTSGSEYITGCVANILDRIFTSGEITYKLNGDRTETVWYQKDGMPAFSGSIVYENTCGGDIFYSTTDGDFDSHNFGSDYRCTNCGNYEPATLVTAENYSSLGLDESYVGYYAIKNASNLYWYSERERIGDISGSIVLLNDITLDNSKAEWIPIVWDGDCTFDGRGHTITLKLDYGTEQDSASYGLFGTCNYCVVKNLFLDGYLTVNTTGNVGAVAASMYRTTISGVISTVNVTNTCTTGGNVGGLAGYFGGQHDTTNNQYSKIENCAVYADVTGYNAGGLVGQGWGGYQYWDITNAAYVGNITTTDTTNGAAGAIVGYQATDYNTSTFTNIYWCEKDGLGFYGKRDTENQVYTNTESKTAEQFASGEVTWLLNGASPDGIWKQTIGLHDYPVFEGATVNLNGTTYENTGNYIYVEISWTEMSFTYTGGEWNPETHAYENSGWVPDTEGGGTVTVTNKGSAVYVSLGYTSLVDGVSGSFDPDVVCLENGESHTASLNLTGEPTGGPFTDRQIGTVTVTISQTPPAAMTATWKAGDTVEYIGKNGKVYSCYIVSESDGKYMLLTKEPEIFITKDAEELETLKETQLEAVGATRYPAFDSSKAEYAKYESYALESLSASNNYEQYISLAVNSAGEYVWLWKDGTYLVVIEQDISTYYENYDIKACFYYIFEVPAS